MRKTDPDIEATKRVMGAVGTFLKPCAFAAPQAASGLDQRPDPGALAFVSSMPRIASLQEKKPLDKLRLI